MGNSRQRKAARKGGKDRTKEGSKNIEKRLAKDNLVILN